MVFSKVGGDIQMSMDINEAIKEDIQVSISENLCKLTF